MSLTAVVGLNLGLSLLLVVALLWLLGHAGVYKAREHELQIIRSHSRAG